MSEKIVSLDIARTDAHLFTRDVGPTNIPTVHSAFQHTAGQAEPRDDEVQPPARVVESLPGILFGAATLWWATWLNRNDVVFNNAKLTPFTKSFVGLTIPQPLNND